MPYTKDKPMSADTYADHIGPRKFTRQLLVIVACVAIIVLVVELVTSGFSQSRSVVLVLALLVICAYVSRRLVHTERRIDHEWHRFRGNIMWVESPMQRTDQHASSAKWVPIHFEGDKGKTYVPLGQYMAHARWLKDGTRNVLIVRRSLKVGSPDYEGYLR
jgi:hypothetical protein